MPHRELSIGAENVFTPPLALRAGDTATVSVSGTFSATVTLQREFADALGTWHDVATYTQATETSYTAPETEYIRIGVKTSGFTSGAAVCRIGTDRAQPWVEHLVHTQPYVGDAAFAANPFQRMRPRVAFAGGGQGGFNGVAGPP